MPRNRAETVEHHDQLNTSGQELDQRNVYWSRVKEVLREVFDTDEVLADQARNRLESFESERQESLKIFYHATPLEVAADLAGYRDSDITLDQKRAFQKLLKRWNLKDFDSPPGDHIEVVDPED
jgi:hypothetical protein